MRFVPSILSHERVAVFMDYHNTLHQRLRFQGIRIEVAAAPGSASLALRAAANDFIDLTQLGEEVAHLLIPAPEPVRAEPLPPPELAPEEDDPAWDPAA